MNISINFPPELLGNCSVHVDSTNKRNFSMVSRGAHASVLRATRCIRIFSAGSFLAPHHILIDTYKRYPNLVQIIFGTAKKEGEGQFKQEDRPYFETLAAYFEEHPPLTVKKIEFEELTTNQKFNGLFLKALGHKGLEHVRIRTKGEQSTLTEVQVQPLIDNSPQLKTFVYEGFLSTRNVTLSFEKLIQLSKVKLLDWKGAASTIQSLKACKDLKELVINYNGFGRDRFEVLMSEDIIWDLKRLTLSGMIPYDHELEAILKKFRNLKWLKASLAQVSDVGIEKIGTFCPKLKILELRNKIISDSSLDKLTKSLPLLEVISIEYTASSMSAVAENCKNLRMIQVNFCNKIDKPGIDALIEHCKELRAVKFSRGEVDLAEIERLVSALKTIRYVELHGINVSKKQKQQFYKNHPEIQETPYTFSVKKLCSQSI